MGQYWFASVGGKLSIWQRWRQHPEKLWLRKCLFFVHLCVGAGAGVYIVLISVSGSIIVYRNQLETKFPASISSAEWLVNLHENLLFGDRGRFVNGIGSACLTLLCLTGLIIWWPGIKDWRRSLTINWRASFARVNWDLHSALGFWFFFFVVLWGISGFYFSFPNIVNALFSDLGFSDSVAQKFLSVISLLHFGRFSWFSEALWTFLGLVPAILSVTGIFLCCRRMIYGSGAKPLSNSADSA